MGLSSGTSWIYKHPLCMMSNTCQAKPSLLEVQEMARKCLHMVVFPWEILGGCKTPAARRAILEEISRVRAAGHGAMSTADTGILLIFQYCWK